MAGDPGGRAGGAHSGVAVARAVRFRAPARRRAGAGEGARLLPAIHHDDPAVARVDGDRAVALAERLRRGFAARGAQRVEIPPQLVLRELAVVVRVDAVELLAEPRQRLVHLRPAEPAVAVR